MDLHDSKLIHRKQGLVGGLKDFILNDFIEVKGEEVNFSIQLFSVLSGWKERKKISWPR